MLVKTVLIQPVCANDSHFRAFISPLKEVFHSTHIKLRDRNQRACSNRFIKYMKRAFDRAFTL